jgi:hypothetical protein
MKQVSHVLRCIPEDGSLISYKNLLLNSKVCKEVLSRSVKYLEETMIIERVREKGRGRYEKILYRRASPFNWASMIGFACEDMQASKVSGNFDSVQAVWISWSLAFLDHKIITWLNDFALDEDKKHAEKILNGRIEYVLKTMAADLPILVEDGLSKNATDRITKWLGGEITIPQNPYCDIPKPEFEKLEDTPPP